MQETLRLAPPSRPGATGRVKMTPLQVIPCGTAPGRVHISIRKKILSDRAKTTVTSRTHRAAGGSERGYRGAGTALRSQQRQGKETWEITLGKGRQQHYKIICFDEENILDLLKERQQTQNAVTCARPQVSKPRFNTDASLPEMQL